MHPFIRFCLATPIVALFAGNADALSGPACGAYAFEATKAAQIASELGCGFGNHPRWGTHLQGHDRWCRSADQASVDFEVSERNKALAKCRACRGYTNEANGFARDNTVYHCHGTGPRWGSGEGHMAWCMAQSDDTRVAEANERENEIRFCQGKFRPEQLNACTAYADKAVEQAKFNREKKCHTQGPRFSEDWTQHFSWCVGHIEPDGVKMAALTKQESDGRDAENKTCMPRKWDRRKNKTVPGQLKPIPSPGPSPFGAADKKSGQGAMDRLGGGAAAPAPSGGFNTMKPNTAPAVPPAKLGGPGAASPTVPERVLPKSKSGM